MMRSPRPGLCAHAMRAVAVALLLGASGGISTAGHDDFEFGQKLAGKGYFDLAKKVYEGILADPQRADGEKDRARYGMAVLGKEEAYTAAGRPDVAYADAKKKFEDASAAIEEFVTKYPNDPKADEARLEVGKVLLDFNSWAAGIADDPEALKTRKTDATTALSDAQKAVARALDIFKALGQSPKQETKDLAAYFEATAQYARGKAYPKCSADAVNAFKEAAKKLEDYATANEERLTGIYTLDVLGLTEQELAACESDPELRTQHYRRALDWFVACAEVTDDSSDHLTIISRGYFHVGKLCNEAGKQPKYDFPKEGLRILGRMTSQRPRTKKHEFGLRAMLEWAKLEAAKGNKDAAVKIAREASDLASAGGFSKVQSEANATLAETFKAGGSGDATPSGGGDPDIAMKLAENAYANGKYAEAIPLYQSAIAAAPKTQEGILKYVLPGWRRIGLSYKNLGRPLEAAVAFDAMIDEWRAGRIPQNAERATEIGGAGDAEKAALAEIFDKTGDPAVKIRLNALSEELPRLLGKYLQMGDQHFSAALRRFNMARDEKEKNAADAAWRTSMQEAVPLFQQAADSPTAQKQDDARTYLVRIPYELGDFDAAVKKADEILAWWESAAGKKVLEGSETMAANRKVERAKVVYYKGASLYERKRVDEALAILEPYGTEHPSVDDLKLYRNLAAGLVIQALIQKKEIEKASLLLEELIRVAPDYYLLHKIVFALADYYNEKADQLNASLKKIVGELTGSGEAGDRGLVGRFSKAFAEENQLRSRLSDLQAQARVIELRLMNEKNTPIETERLKEEQKANTAEIAKSREALAKNATDRAEVEKKVEALRAERARLRAEIAGPWAMAAKLYKQWDDAVKLADAVPGARRKRSPENVRGFADRFWVLADLKPEETSYWADARQLYEDYLAFKEVADQAPTDPKKRLVLGRLGQIYYHLAEIATDPKEAKVLYERAVEHLQNVVANNPANTRLVVGLLSGEYVTVSFPDIEGRRSIPVRRQPDIAAFRAHVQDLGGELVPRYANNRDDERYRAVLERFKDRIKEASDTEVQKIVGSLKDAGFDFALFGELATTSPDFLLAMAHSYAKSGTQENAQKALNAAQAVWNVGRTKAQDDSPEWWEARTIVLDVYVATAERLLKASGPEAPEGKQSATRAQEMMVQIKKLWPHLGGPERHEQTLKEWLAIQTRLKAVLAGYGVRETPVDLAKEAPPPEEAPPQEPAAVEPPKDPGMGGAMDPAPGGAAMDDAAMDGAGK